MNIQQYILQAAANDITLTEINLSGKHLSDADIIPLIEHFKHNYEAASRITNIYLDNNNLISPPNLMAFVALKTLYLNDNELKETPDLTQNVALEELHLENNEMILPPSLAANAMLEILILSHNNLILAPDITSNINLRKIDLDDNNLTSPPDITELLKLEMLSINKNPLSTASIIALVLMHASISEDLEPEILFDDTRIDSNNDLTHDILHAHFYDLRSDLLPIIESTEFKDAILYSLKNFTDKKKISPINSMRRIFDIRSSRNTSIAPYEILNENITMFINAFAGSHSNIKTLNKWLISEEMHNIEQILLSSHKNKFHEISAGDNISRSQETSSGNNSNRKRFKQSM